MPSFGWFALFLLLVVEVFEHDKIESYSGKKNLNLFKLPRMCWNVATYLLIIALGLYIRHYLTSYASEKGKNLATKEDIEDITKKIETVKSDLSIFVQNKVKFSAHQYEALMEFYKDYYNAYQFLSDVSTRKWTYYVDSNFAKLRRSMEALQKQLSRSVGKLEVFFI